MSTICTHGCASATACTGACQPTPIVRTGKHCKWCARGIRLIGTDHWEVKSIVPARMTIRACVAFAQRESV